MTKMISASLLALAGSLLFGQNPRTAVYPDAVPTDSTLGVWNGPAQTPVAASFGAAATSFTVASSAVFKYPVFVKVGAEKIKLCSATNATTVAVCSSGRAQDGTSAQVHYLGELVETYDSPQLIQQMQAEMKAIANTLGANFSAGSVDTSTLWTKSGGSKVIYAEQYCSGTYNTACLVAAVAALPSGVTGVLELGDREYTLNTTWTISRANTYIRNGRLKATNSLNADLVVVNEGGLVFDHVYFDGNRSNQSATSNCLKMNDYTAFASFNVSLQVHDSTFMSCRNFAITSPKMNGWFIARNYFDDTGAAHISVGAVSAVAVYNLMLQNNIYRGGNYDNSVIDSGSLVELKGRITRVYSMGNTVAPSASPNPTEGPNHIYVDNTGVGPSYLYACGDIDSSGQGMVEFNSYSVADVNQAVFLYSCHSPDQVAITTRFSGALPVLTDALTSSSVVPFLVPLGTYCAVDSITLLLKPSTSGGGQILLKTVQVNSGSSGSAQLSTYSTLSGSNRVINTNTNYSTPGWSSTALDPVQAASVSSTSVIIPVLASGTLSVDMGSMTVICRR